MSKKILFRKKYFPDVRGAHGFRVFVPESRRNEEGNGRREINWGRGHVLGR